MDMFVYIILTAIVGLSSCYEDDSPFLGRPQLYGPSVALVKKAVDFYCEPQVYPKNVTILLQLFKGGDHSKMLGEYTSLDGQRGTFPILIKTSHDGNLECVARAQNNTSVEPTVSNRHHLKVIEPVKEAEVIVSSGQSEFFEGRTLELQCKLNKGTYVTYTWLLDGQRITESRYQHFSDSYLRVYRTTSKDSGSYMCIAQNSYNDTNYNSTSSAVDITVKDPVSRPEISFHVVKEDTDNYYASVSCDSLRGTPPITFSLYIFDDLFGNATVEDRNATFTIPIVLAQHLGWLQCQADNGDQIMHSQWIALEVVPVEGPVTMHYDYDTGQNYAVVGMSFYCKATKGSHPKFEWFLNKTLLHGKGSFYRVVDEPPVRSILQLAVGQSSAGTYHCVVSDNYDNTTAVRSRGVYLDKEVLNRIPVLVVAIVFGCFTLIILLVSICCCIGIIYRPRRNDQKPLEGVEMKKMLAAYEEDMEFSEYSDDADVMKVRADEFDQASQESVDDWPWFKTEKTAELNQEECQPVLLSSGSVSSK